MFHKKSCRVCEVFVIGCGGPLAFGCNVGAFFSGIACISLHGWLWIAADEVGSIA